VRLGRRACADQSTISETLNACDGLAVSQMRQALQDIYRTHSQGISTPTTKVPGTRYRFDRVIAGRQAEHATQGYFSGQRNRRGRQLGRAGHAVWTKLFRETISRHVFT